MAKYQKLQEPVFVARVESISSRHGGDVWELTLTGIQSQTNYKTYCDPSNNNWRHWEGIVRVAQRKGVVLSGLKLKDPDKKLINADSSVTPEYIVPTEELLEILEDYWRSQDQWGKLFGDSEDDEHDT